MATFTYSQIGQSRPANTNPATLATLAANTNWIGARVVIANNTSSAATFRVYHDDDGASGTSYAIVEALAYDVSLAGNTSTAVEGIMASTTGGTIGIRSGTADALTFTAYACKKEESA